VLLVWCHLLTGYEPGLVRDNLCKVAPRPPLPVVQVHGEGVSPKGREFRPPSARALYTCGSVAGRSRVRGSVRYITHDSCAISVVPPFNRLWARVGVMVLNMHWLPYLHKPKVMSLNHVVCAFFPPVRSWVSNVWACRPIAG